MRRAGMTVDDYAAALKDILSAHAQPVLDRLAAIRQALPPKARRVTVGVHPAQDGDGFFDVVVHLEGPDLYVLNKAIAPHRVLFEVKVVDGKVQPDAPMFDPDEVDFSVNDAIVDSCMAWLEGLWRQLGGVGLPAVAFGEEGYGSVASKPLLP